MCCIQGCTNGSQAASIFIAVAAATAITLLVVGILGVQGTVSLPPVGARAMIYISSAIILTGLIAACRCTCQCR